MAQGYDTRTFTEIYYSLPKAAKDMLYDRLKTKGVTSQNIYRWTHGSVPRPNKMRDIQRALLTVFGINTLPYTLFPGDSSSRKKINKLIQDKYKEATAWDGQVSWPTKVAVENAEPNHPLNPEY